MKWSWIWSLSSWYSIVSFIHYGSNDFFTMYFLLQWRIWYDLLVFCAFPFVCFMVPGPIFLWSTSKAPFPQANLSKSRMVSDACIYSTFCIQQNLLWLQLNHTFLYFLATVAFISILYETKWAVATFTPRNV